MGERAYYADTSSQRGRVAKLAEGYARLNPSSTGSSSTDMVADEGMQFKGYGRLANQQDWTLLDRCDGCVWKWSKISDVARAFLPRQVSARLLLKSVLMTCQNAEASGVTALNIHSKLTC